MVGGGDHDVARRDVPVHQAVLVQAVQGAGQVNGDAGRATSSASPPRRSATARFPPIHPERVPRDPAMDARLAAALRDEVGVPDVLDRLGPGRSVPSSAGEAGKSAEQRFERHHLASLGVGCRIDRARLAAGRLIARLELAELVPGEHTGPRASLFAAACSDWRHNTPEPSLLDGGFGSRRGSLRGENAALQPQMRNSRARSTFPGRKLCGRLMRFPSMSVPFGPSRCVTATPSPAISREQCIRITYISSSPTSTCLPVFPTVTTPASGSRNAPLVGAIHNPQPLRVTGRNKAHPGTALAATVSPGTVAGDGRFGGNQHEMHMAELHRRAGKKHARR